MSRRIITAFLFILPFLVLAGMGIWLALRTTVTTPAAPFAYSRVEYQPEQASVCPGDHLRYTVGFTVTRAPALLIIGATWFDLDHNMIAAVNPAAVVPYTQTFLNGRYPIDVLVPPLPAGHYLRVVGAGEYSSRAAVYQVPFTVPTTCKVP